ncbi:MAG: polysaccharide pyruvyl transferase family protein [Bacteroidales bacterium]|nr:polysaccharide pyruvyl transferase family protein [Bacteroidales bacterium]
MKIGILTIHSVNNYGAELQCCALYQKLQKMGYDAEVINFLFGIHHNHDFTGEKLTVPISLKTKIKVKLLPIVQDFFCLFYQKNKTLRNQRFQEFHAKYNKLTKKVYPSVKSLNEANFNYDVLCIGSDQVWNYEKGYSLEPFFASFDKKGTKKISYGSSIGLSQLTIEAEEVFKKELSGFASLSVREQQASDLLHKLLKRNVDVVLDPTLILNNKEWLEVAKTDMCPKEKYVLVYIVTIKPCNYVLEVARKVAKERGLKIVRICRDAYPEHSGNDVKEVLTAGPSDFVGLFANAEFVVTNSFHGTAFSINFSKPFFSVIKSKHSTNSRLTNILKKLKLEDRIIRVGSPFPEICDIDYRESTKILEEERFRSIEYLKKSLG